MGMIRAAVSRVLVAAFAVGFLAQAASAQITLGQFPTVNSGEVVGGVAIMCVLAGVAKPCDASTPLQIAGTFSASLSGFTPSASGARGTPFTVTSSDSSGNLPTGTVDIVSNPSANLMYCNVNGVAATASDQPIAGGGGWFAFTLPGGVSTLHCIAPAGNATANMLGGSGLPTGTGGGSGGGGGGGAVTIADGADTTLGAKADARSTATDTTAITLMQVMKEISFMEQNPASRAVTNAGTFATQATLAAETTKAIGVVRNADGAGNLLTSTGNALDINIKSGGGTGGTALADEAPFTQGTTSMTPMGCLFTSSVTNLTTGQAGVARCTNDRQVMVSDAALLAAVQAPLPAGSFVGLQANTTGGCTPGAILTAASNNSTSIKASAGTLCELSFINTTTGVFDIRLYDTASAPTCSSATGVVANYVAQSNATSPGFSINLGPFGKAFTTGIGVCITGANANNDNTNAATGGNLNYAFK